MSTVTELATGERMGPVTYHNGCARAMVLSFSCGTPFRATYKMEGDTLLWADATFCGCLSPSPIPCCMGCGFGPCAWVGRFARESDTKYVGTGESYLAGGCLQPCFHNKGDIVEVTSEGLMWSPGGTEVGPMGCCGCPGLHGSCANFPCMYGKPAMTFAAMGGGPVASAVMER